MRPRERASLALRLTTSVGGGVRPEYRNAEVAPATLGCGRVHLERVLEVEELLGADAVVDELDEGLTKVVEIGGVAAPSLAGQLPRARR